MKFLSARLISTGSGAIIALVQALLLFHLLVDCYPYKMMRNPSARFYATIGYAGLCLAPALSVWMGWLLSKRSLSYVPAVICLLCPLFFLFIFLAAHSLLGVDFAAHDNLDFASPAVPFFEFIQYGFKVLTGGVATGTALGLIVWEGWKLPD